MGGVSSKPDDATSHKQREEKLMSDWSTPPPWPVWRALHLLHTPPPPPIRVLDIAQGYMKSQMIYTAVKLRISDKLAEKPMTKEELAAATGAISERVERLMVGLIALGLFALHPQDTRKYVNNELSATLRTDHPNSMAALVAHLVEDCYGTWAHLSEAVTEGGCAYVSKRMYGGKDFWEYLKDHAAQAQQFDRAMTSMDSLGAQAIALDGPFGKAKRVLDIGGGRGHFLAKILMTYPEVTGLVYDTPDVITHSTRAAWSEGGDFAPLSRRVELASGSFFDAATIPQARDGDAYMLRYILHDWDDEACSKILLNLRSRIGDAQGARLLVCDICLPERDREVDPVAIKYLLDLHMCVMLGAKERSRSQWNALLRKAKFSVVEFHATRSIVHVIEAVPV